MQAELDLRIRQLHEALGEVRTDDLDSVTPEVRRGPGLYSYKMDFSQGKTEAELANRVELFVANIARLKDLLKAWCTRQAKQFDGDKLINGNRDVAIIHDLWIRDKHFDPESSRSGLYPRLIERRQGARLTAPAVQGGTTTLLVDPATSRLKKVGGGTAEIVITASVVDQQRNKLGDLLDIAMRAIAAWEETLVQAGVALPPRGTPAR